MIKVFLIDAHEVLRQGIRLIIERDRDVEVIGEVGDPESAIMGVTEAQPDVVLLDLDLSGGGSGATALAFSTSATPNDVFTFKVKSAARFGVRNIHDPDQNIGGGVSLCAAGVTSAGGPVAVSRSASSRWSSGS